MMGYRLRVQYFRENSSKFGQVWRLSFNKSLCELGQVVCVSMRICVCDWRRSWLISCLLCWLIMRKRNMIWCPRELTALAVLCAFWANHWWHFYRLSTSQLMVQSQWQGDGPIQASQKLKVSSCCISWLLERSGLSLDESGLQKSL